MDNAAGWRHFTGWSQLVWIRLFRRWRGGAKLHNRFHSETTPPWAILAHLHARQFQTRLSDRWRASVSFVSENHSYIFIKSICHSTENDAATWTTPDNRMGGGNEAIHGSNLGTGRCCCSGADIGVYWWWIIGRADDSERMRILRWQLRVSWNFFRSVYSPVSMNGLAISTCIGNGLSSE